MKPRVANMANERFDSFNIAIEKRLRKSLASMNSVSGYCFISYFLKAPYIVGTLLFTQRVNLVWATTIEPKFYLRKALQIVNRNLFGEVTQ